jgi:hypothetical protein
MKRWVGEIVMDIRRAFVGCEDWARMERDKPHMRWRYLTQQGRVLEIKQILTRRTQVTS